MKQCFALSVALVMTCHFPARAGTPAIGDKAPAVKASKWLVAPPPALPGEKGGEKHVFLVEFWATWCAPCRRSIPHLAELHRKHGKDGLVIVSISNEEENVVGRFLKKGNQGKPMDMPYFVGCDDDMKTNENWMSDIEGIPHAFLVNREGIVVWTGNPLGDTAQLDRAITQVLAGKYDVATAKTAALSAKKANELTRGLQAAYGRRDEKEVFNLLDQLIAVKPADAQPYLIKRQLLEEFNRASEIQALEQSMEKALQDSAEAMLRLAEVELERDVSERNPGMLLRCARRADALSKGRDPEALATLARAHCELGMIDAAIETQARAVGLAAEADRDRYKKALKYYEDARALARSQAAGPTGSRS
jgi:thiol-disulfide isomerase/thioredoxin